jgi:hypothetical protein
MGVDYWPVVRAEVPEVTSESTLKVTFELHEHATRKRWLDSVKALPGFKHVTQIKSVTIGTAVVQTATLTFDLATPSAAPFRMPPAFQSPYQTQSQYPGARYGSPAAPETPTAYTQYSRYS